MWKHTSVSCSRCPIKDRDSPKSCRWAAASIGSTSGTRAGDRDTVPGALFGDTIPVPVPTTFMMKQNQKSTVMRTDSESTQGWEMTHLNQLKTFTSKIPLLLPSLAVLCLTVVASALFCLCCRYWAFCLQTYAGENTGCFVHHNNCKLIVTFKRFSSINHKLGGGKNILICLSLASPSTPPPTFCLAHQRLQMRHTNIV